MFKRFYPDEYIASVYEVDYAALFAMGYRAVLYDIDNTLVLHDAGADDRARELFDRLRACGLRSCLISNNHEGRVASFAKDVAADAYLYDSHKPSARAYREAAKRLGLSEEQLLFFGDQLFTDVLGAKNAGIRAVLVRPIGKEKLFRIRVKRVLEKPILAEYKKKSVPGRNAIPMHRSEGQTS